MGCAWKPHCGIFVELNCERAAVSVQQLQRFPPIGRTFQMPTNWTSFWEDDGPFYIMGQPITGLGSDLARWATQTEKYLTQLLHKPITGRGSRINFYQAPLVDQGRSMTWRKGHLAYCEKMKVRINVVHQTHNTRVGQDLTNALEALHLHASEHMSQDLFKAILGHWIQHPDNEPTELRRLSSLAAPMKSTRFGWRKHMRKGSHPSSAASAKGIFVGHGLSRLQAREEQWGHIWQPRQDPRPLRSWAIGDVAVQIHHVSLKSLQGTRNDLPPVFGFLKSSQSCVPACPEEVLLALIKAVVHLPDGVQMLERDGVPRIWLARIHVEDNVN